MLPVLTIVGRPNVGKSTLYNRLTKTRDAIVGDMPGITRDRQYGEGCFEHHAFIVVDTGGIAEPDDPEMGAIAKQLRILTEKPVVLVVNKADRQHQPEIVSAEFYALGLKSMQVISAQSAY